MISNISHITIFRGIYTYERAHVAHGISHRQSGGWRVFELVFLARDSVGGAGQRGGRAGYKGSDTLDHRSLETHPLNRICPSAVAGLAGGRVSPSVGGTPPPPPFRSLSPLHHYGWGHRATFRLAFFHFFRLGCVIAFLLPF